MNKATEIIYYDWQRFKRKYKKDMQRECALKGYAGWVYIHLLHQKLAEVALLN